MRKLFLIPFIFLLGCHSKETTFNVPKTTDYITVDGPYCSFQYPNSWERKKSPYNSETVIDIQSHAYSDLHFVYMAIPDSLVDETKKGYENPIKDSYFISSNIIYKNKKKYFKTITKTHGRPATCINIVCLEENRQYSFTYCYDEKLTPKDKIEEGLKALETFNIK